MQLKTAEYKEGANASAVRKLMMGLSALVVLSVSGYGTVIYIQLMTKVFPSGPLQLACYMGAAANFLLMIVLLVGKFVWFRPGAHEVASWLVTATELLVAILNMMLAFQLANNDKLSAFMLAWQYLAPVSPIFSMVGATVLLMTSTEMRRQHRAMEIEEEKERSEQAFGLAMHRAQMGTKGQYLKFVTTGLEQELNAPERQQEMRGHASLLVTQILTEMSGLHASTAAQLPALSQRPAALPAPVADGSLDDEDEWLAQVNQRIEHERARRAAVSGSLDGTQVHTQEDRLADDDVPLYAPAEVERLRHIAQAAQARGYSLDKMARFLGVPPSQMSGATYEEQLVRLALAAEQRGYGLDRLEGFLGLSSEGGDARKKK